MKRMGLLFLFIFFAVTAAAYAHPPSDIKITFDSQTKTLQAVVYHSSSSPFSHYIDKVDISLNGKVVATLTFSQQKSGQFQMVTYPMPDIKDQDVLSVEGYCNLAGKLKKELTVKIEQ